MPRLGGISSDIGTKNQHLGINIWFGGLVIRNFLVPIWLLGNQVAIL